mgnify:CR=1 FL=1
MDITHIRTFLAVIETGSFLGAAKIVHVTQSTVSVRIRTLEERLGTSLFSRGKQGAVPTPSGIQFLHHASAMVRLWDQARMDVGLSIGHNTVIRIGGQVSLWDGYLIPWLAWMRRNAPDIALRAEMGHALALTQQLVEGSLDFAVMYRPQHRPGFLAEKIFEEEIILVSTDPNKQDIFDDSYVLSYWGPEFQADHALNFPDLTAPTLSMDLGTRGIEYLLINGGSCYMPRRVVANMLNAGKLWEVDDKPAFKYPAYVMFSQAIEQEVVSSVMTGLKACAVNAGVASSI